MGSTSHRTRSPTAATSSPLATTARWSTSPAAIRPPSRRRRGHRGARRRARAVDGHPLPPRGEVPPRDGGPRPTGRRRLHPAPRPHRQAGRAPDGPAAAEAAPADGRESRGSSARFADWRPRRSGCGARGPQPQCPLLATRFGLHAGLVTAVDLIRGLGVLSGIEVVEVRRRHRLVRHELRGQARRRPGPPWPTVPTSSSIHVEASDEAGHNGELEAKMQALENWDRRIIAALVEALDDLGPWRMLLLPDHPTPVRLKTHTMDSVPYLLFDSSTDGPRAASTPSRPPPSRPRCRATSSCPGWSLTRKEIARARLCSRA